MHKAGFFILSFLALTLSRASAFASPLLEQDGILLDSNLHIELAGQNILSESKFILPANADTWTTLVDQGGIKVLAHYLKSDSEVVVLEYRIFDRRQNAVVATSTLKIPYTAPVLFTQKPTGEGEAGEISIGARVNRVHYQTTR